MPSVGGQPHLGGRATFARVDQTPARRCEGREWRRRTFALRLLNDLMAGLTGACQRQAVPRRGHDPLRGRSGRFFAVAESAPSRLFCLSCHVSSNATPQQVSGPIFILSGEVYAFKRLRSPGSAAAAAAAAAAVTDSAANGPTRPAVVEGRPGPLKDVVQAALSAPYPSLHPFSLPFFKLVTVQ